MKERDFQTRLMLALSKIEGVRVWRQNVGAVRVPGSTRYFHAGPPKGAADITGIVSPEGWRIEIECKAEGGRRSPSQIRWAVFIVASGGLYLVAKAEQGVGLTVDAFLDALRARRAACS